MVYFELAESVVVVPSLVASDVAVYCNIASNFGQSNVRIPGENVLYLLVTLSKGN